MKFVIYVILCNDDNIFDFYIGSTDNLSRRISQHKKNTTNKSSKKYWLKLYRTIRENGGFDNWNVIKLDEFETPTYNDGRIIEYDYISRLKPTLNKMKIN